MTTFAFDDRNINWQRLGDFPHLHFHIMDIDERNKIADVLFKFAANEKILLHRHPFYQLSYSHQGKSTTRFVRPRYVAAIKKELAAYKRFRGLTQEWIALALTLSQLRLEQARRELDE